MTPDPPPPTQLVTTSARAPDVSPVRRGQFPLSAVVGADEAKLALVLAAADRNIGGVLLRGDKGSAKSTLARGLAAAPRRAGRSSSCPWAPPRSGWWARSTWRAALTGGEVRFQPGLLAAADGGVLYVDEVNLLADHLVDALLDAAASGVNRVERDGVSHSHPARFLLVGSMNPEEGDLRPQLLDRFGLAVDVRNPTEPATRAEVVRRRQAFDADPDRLRRRLGRGRGRAAPPPGRHPPGHRRRRPAGGGVRRLRGRGGREHAGRHRPGPGRGRPRRLARTADRPPPTTCGRSPTSSSPTASGASPSTTPAAASSAVDDALDDALGAALAGRGPAATTAARTGDGEPAEDRVDAPDAPGAGRHPRRAPSPSTRRTGPGGGRPSAAPTGAAPSAAGPPTGAVGAVAVVPTIQAAAARRAGDRGTEPRRRRSAADLREPVKEARTGNLLVLAVDASGSMGMDDRMAAVKGALLGLLVDAYQRRDRVALVTFGGDGAEVVLRPTGSVEVARARLESLPTGGETPLAEGIRVATVLAHRSATPTLRPLLVVVTDGRATGRRRAPTPTRWPPPWPRPPPSPATGCRRWSSTSSPPPAPAWAWPPTWPRPWAPATSPSPPSPPAAWKPPSAASEPGDGNRYEVRPFFFSHSAATSSGSWTGSMSVSKFQATRSSVVMASLSALRSSASLAP